MWWKCLFGDDADFKIEGSWRGDSVLGSKTVRNVDLINICIRVRSSALNHMITALSKPSHISAAHASLQLLSLAPFPLAVSSLFEVCVAAVICLLTPGLNNPSFPSRNPIYCRVWSQESTRIVNSMWVPARLTLVPWAKNAWRISPLDT